MKRKQIVTQITLDEETQRILTELKAGNLRLNVSAICRKAIKEAYANLQKKEDGK